MTGIVTTVAETTTAGEGAGTAMVRSQGTAIYNAVSYELMQE